MGIQWDLHGRLFANCNCAYGCPCQFNALPTQGHCQAVVGIEIDKGHHGDTGLDQNPPPDPVETVTVTASQATGDDVLHLVDANGAQADVVIRVDVSPVAEHSPGSVGSPHLGVRPVGEDDEPVGPEELRDGVPVVPEVLVVRLPDRPAGSSPGAPAPR